MGEAWTGSTDKGSGLHPAKRFSRYKSVPHVATRFAIFATVALPHPVAA